MGVGYLIFGFANDHHYSHIKLTSVIFDMYIHTCDSIHITLPPSSTALDADELEKGSRLNDNAVDVPLLLTNPSKNNILSSHSLIRS